jgi:hypothetical protein
VVGIGTSVGNIAKMMPENGKVTSAQASGIEKLPVWKGAGVNFFWPQTVRVQMEIPHARLFPATAREKSVEAAAG